ncbi:MAG: TVP38/TMEM64 family protein, partial [Alphaproteobacteria bacterium]|nr:TVP38/TMEM64 family protein [Alphaproteobacteria bacterium]
MPSTNDSKPRLSITRLIPLLILGAGLIAFFALGLNKYLTLDLLKENREVLKTWVYEHKTQAVLLFIVAYVITAAFSLPLGALLSVAGGFLFGSIFGAMWIVIGATIGATILFLVAKTALGEPLRQR